eukprot:TRINITY_DN11879_c0_g2_i5.p1 TRINITY_DN11879_c0_g2~~TRINITY_DN11879_c0_g2_i5.p1  ORF type:complete len:565 (+),score=106.59 TRINITY_DN11879_c0_g2_i5:117-1811(+)
MSLMLRVRTPSGMIRVQTRDGEQVQDFFQRVAEMAGIDSQFILMDAKSESLLRLGPSVPMASLGLRRGDMLQLRLQGSAEPGTVQRGAEPVQSTLDPVDRELFKHDGRVARKRDSYMCRHGPEGSCINCTSLEPYDERVLNLKDPPIKFLSFHSYLRKLDHGADKGKLSKLETPQCKIKPCKACPPGSVCTACQPSAVTLQRQTFRHVDYVEFESREVLGRFLDAWTTSGVQRLGYMYGRYEPYDQVPLGIKAVVAAIYEPPQTGTPDGLELEEDSYDELVEQMAAMLGLQQVGWIFTDLESVDATKGTVQYKRYVSPDADNDHATVLTSEEILMAGMLQNSHPNPVPVKYNNEGQFGSKYVTVVISGNQDEMIGTQAYQVSTQAMALTRDDVLRPSDHPAMMAVKPSSEEQYVPEVFYVTKDEYKNTIKKSARPVFPVEYLFVDMESGASEVDSNHTFHHAPAGFPRENRAALGQLQDLRALGQHLAQGAEEQMLRDFHVLLFLATNEQCAELSPALPQLAEAIAAKDSSAIKAWTLANPFWSTLKLLAQETGMSCALRLPAL